MSEKIYIEQSTSISESKNDICVDDEYCEDLDYDEDPEELLGYGSAFSGPLPHPGWFQRYEEAVPGSGDRILKMAEEEAAHRHKMDNEMLKTDSRDSLAGIIAGTIICLATIIGGVFVVKLSHNTAGTILGSFMGIGGLASIFVRSTIPAYRQSKRESSDEQRP